MDELLKWLGDLHALLPDVWVGLVIVLASVLCGALVGLEREKADKPAGLRTLLLITLGASTYTLASMLIAGDESERGRIAAQVASGVGFLGAGAIIQQRGTVLGLTTGATIWATAAIGVLIGVGYVAAGIGLTVIVLLTLTFVRRAEVLVNGRCTSCTVRIRFRSENGKTFPLIRGIVDHFQADAKLELLSSNAESVARITFCDAHRDHRMFLSKLAELPSVLAIEPAE